MLTPITQLQAAGSMRRCAAIAQTYCTQPHTARRAIIGLGNPGKKYDATRHNIGFAVLDRLLARAQLPAWSHVGAAAADTTGGLIQHRAHDLSEVLGSDRSRAKNQQAVVPYPTVALWLAKPDTFMNRSGRACRKLCERPPAFAQADPPAFKLKRNPRALNKGDEIIVVCDDASLPFGEFKLKFKGSAGGQNGLRDIINRMGTDKFTRLRVGVGLPQGVPLDKHVLSRFEPHQQDQMVHLLDFSCELLTLYMHRGYDAASLIANTKGNFEGFIKTRRK